MNQPVFFSTGKHCPGKLFVVATPIGNMEDITLRALRLLVEVDLIAAEDTRHTGKLLKYHKISTKLVSCHEHNEEKRSEELIAKMKSGHNIALVSNAGTPAVSDPGYRLIQKSVSENIEVVPVPGASSVIAALSVSGLPTDSFVFIGFAPRKRGKRRSFLADLENEIRTIIFFESPHRLLNLVEDLLLTLGDRRAVLAREITKLHEEFIRGNLSQLKRQIESKGELKGECTLLIEGRPFERQVVSEQNIRKEILALLDEPGEKLSGAVKKIAERLGVSRKMVYDLALKMKKE
ncbi:MAG: 16S rRNA (cytidine(1402)-2'-O)-methyltransferase [Desulfobacterales bacterium]